MTSTSNKINSTSTRDRFRKISNTQPTKERTSEFIGRNIAQHGARAGEVVLGLPGNIKSQFQKEFGKLQEFLLGEEDSLRQEEEKFPQSEKGSIEEIIMNPPTSSELRENLTPLVAEKVFKDKDYLEPRGKGEKFAGELTQDITSFFLPGTKKLNLAVKLGAPILGNLVKQGTAYITGDESLGEKAKLGTMLATTLAGQSNPGKFASKRIGEAKQMIPQNATANTSNIGPRLTPLITRLGRGLRVPSKSKVSQGIRDLSRQIKNQRMSLHSLMDARDNINEWIAEAGGWEIPKPTRDASIRNLNELKRAVIETIDENLNTRFPQAAELYKTGYEAAAVNHASNYISNFIENHFGRKVASVGAKMLFPGLAGGAALLPKTAAIGTALFPLYKTGQVLYRVSKSPTLAKYYQDVITHSLTGNAPAMVKSMEKLDNALKKDEEKTKKGKELSLEEFKERFTKKD